MLIALAVLAGVIGIALAVSAFRALSRARLFGFAVRAIFALPLILIGAALAVFALGTQGMEALTREETAARIKVVPTAPQRYDATVTFADGRIETYDLAGDDIYIDGHIVKWTPLANMLGLHTSYRLDRISGRYRTLEQENTARRDLRDRHAGADRPRRARQAPAAGRLLRRRVRLGDLRAGGRPGRARAHGLDHRPSAAAAAGAARRTQELTRWRR